MEKAKDFIRAKIDADNASGKYGGRVETRFPPEPNGYLHIGHAKAICLNFSVAAEYNGACHLRFDDTNPDKEEVEYVESIKEDVHWLGFDWGQHLYYASDYFDRIYGYAVELIKSGKAYVCHLDTDQIREYRGTLSEPGKNSPYRDRTPGENLSLFEQMRGGSLKDGECSLRAKIDMAHPNINMRDPVLYRIKHASHHRTGDKWCIYPTYDFTHCISDAIENITHSLCTLEFEIHRDLYDWVLDNISLGRHPEQTEFARLELTCTMLSKRKLLQLVNEKIVDGWDDPRMPTLSGLRRRGYTPEAIRAFCDTIGIAKTNSTIDLALLEHHLREDLNKRCPRAMAVLDPLRVVIENYPNGKEEEFDVENNPEDPAGGTRKVPFSKVLLVEREDFQETPPKGYFRLFPGNEVRLKSAYYVTCVKAIKDEKGNVAEVICRYDPESRGGGTKDNRKIKGTIHWVSEKHALEIEARLYGNLFTVPNPGAEEDFKAALNPDSLKPVRGWAEPSLKTAKPGSKHQFMRHGYFCVDKTSSAGMPVFNRTITLKDTWKK